MTESQWGNAAPTTEPAGGGCRHWVGHVIVCGLQPVGLRAVGQLNLAGARVVVVDDEHVGERAAKTVRDWGVPIVARGASLSDSLFDAGAAGAEAVICIEATDLRTLETILLVRDLRSDVRLVAHLDNPAVANAVEEISGAAAVLDVASLFAPAVVDACLGGRVHDIELGEVRFSTVEVVAPRASTLRKLYGNLVPLGVTSATDQNPVVCPGRDLPVKAGDGITLLGTADELHAAGLRPRSLEDTEVPRVGTRAARIVRRVAGQLRTESDRALRLALGAGLVLLVFSTLLLHFGYHLAAPGHHQLTGDSTLAQTLDSVNLQQAASVAIVTSDDLTNIETGLAVRDRLGARWTDTPVVLRVFDRELGGRLEQRFDFRHVWSTAAIAAPWFVGAALGLEVRFSFYVGSHPFLIARLRVSAGGGLRLAMSDLSARIRVIAIGRDGGADGLEHPPRRDTRLAAGDDAYLAGPYEELLEVLKRERQGAAGGG